MDKICRVCLVQKPKMYNIFGVDESDVTLSLFEKIVQCTHVNMTRNENWPNKLCGDCKNDLDVAFRFRMNVESADVALRSISEEEEMNEELLAPQKENPDESLVEEDDHIHDTEIYVEESNVTELIQAFVVEEPEKIQISPKEVRKKHLPPEKEVHAREDPIVIKSEGVQTIMTIPKLSRDEKAPIVKSIMKQTASDGSVKTMVRLARHPVVKKEPPMGLEPKQGQYVCDQCGKEFKKPGALRAHTKRHSTVKPNICSICNKSFTLPVELKRHMRVHSGEKPYDCRYCDKKFSDFGTRVKHERIHSGDRPYVCPYCLKCFTYSNVLKFHIMVHTGEKNYACSECDKRFIKAHQLKCHLATHGIGNSPRRRPKKQSNKIIEETEESHEGSNEMQTMQVVQASDTQSNTQSFMLYLKK